MSDRVSASTAGEVSNRGIRRGRRLRRGAGCRRSGEASGRLLRRGVGRGISDDAFPSPLSPTG
ncbi:MAG: hypothetical protein ACLFR8_02445 [Alkalispirochaeta sp.]